LSDTERLEEPRGRFATPATPPVFP
jgi:hypothetical protein